MTQDNSVVAIYRSHIAAEQAVKELNASGFDMKKLSIVGKDYRTEEQVTGFYTACNRMTYWGTLGAFWGALWGMLTGAAFFIIPGLGGILAAGPVVGWIVAALEGAVVTGGVTALGAGLVSLGIPKNSVLKYEMELKADKFVLIAHGAPEDVERARKVLAASEAEELVTHGEPVPA
jgi:hypothetical protein